MSMVTKLAIKRAVRWLLLLSLCLGLCLGCSGLLADNAAPTTTTAATPEPSAQKIRVASKNFNESYLLSEMLAQLLEADGYPVERKFGLGGTLICYEALRNDEVDVYVEYTGTLVQAILKLPPDTAAQDMERSLAVSYTHLTLPTICSV